MRSINCCPLGRLHFGRASITVMPAGMRLLLPKTTNYLPKTITSIDRVLELFSGD